MPLWWGLALVFILFWSQLLRNYCFGAGYIMGLHTGMNMENVPEGKVSILGDHSICHSEQKSVCVHVSYFEWFPR
jgi:hypothetical protein